MRDYGERKPSKYFFGTTFSVGNCWRWKTFPYVGYEAVTHHEGERSRIFWSLNKYKAFHVCRKERKEHRHARGYRKRV